MSIRKILKLAQKEIIRKFFLLFIFIASITLKTQAQETKSLTLSEAISLSKENNKQLKLSKTKIENSKLQTKQAKNLLLPDLNISSQALYLFNTAKFKSDIPLSSGNSINPDHAVISQATLSVPLFTGFKIKNGITIAKYNQELLETNYKIHEQDIVLQTINAFINLYKAKQAQIVLEANIERTKQIVNDFINYEANGIVARNDLLRVQLQESNAETALIETQKNYRIINYNLVLMLGLPENTILDPKLSFDFLTENLTEEDYLTEASKSRDEFKALDLQKKIAEKNIKSTKGNYYPQISLSGGYMYINLNNIGSLQNATNIGLGIKFNLASLFKNKSAVASAKNEAQQVQDNLEILNDQIKNQTHSAFENYNYSKDMMDVYEKALDQANENYRIVKNKHDNGLANTDDLLTADVEQLQAALNHAYGKADIQMAYFNLLRQTGLISK